MSFYANLMPEYEVTSVYQGYLLSTKAVKYFPNFETGRDICLSNCAKYSGYTVVQSYVVI